MQSRWGACRRKIQKKVSRKLIYGEALGSQTLRSMVVSTASVVCPYCGREQTPYARFCDRCGTNLSAFWGSRQPLVQQVYGGQSSLDGAGRSAPALTNRARGPQPNLPVLRRWKLLGKLTRKGATVTSNPARSEPKIAQRQPPSLQGILPSTEGRIIKTTEQPVLVRPTQTVRGDVVWCYTHAERKSRHICAICARGICGECSRWAAQDVYVCPECWEPER